jgi:predicted PurR-regulated permease PerM
LCGAYGPASLNGSGRKALHCNRKNMSKRRYSTLAATRSRWSRLWLLLPLLLMLLWTLQAVLLPFALAGVLAYVLRPLGRWLELRMGAGWAAGMTLGAVILLMLIGLLVVLPLFVSQFAELFGRLPLLLLWVDQDLSPWLSMHLGWSLTLDFNGVQEWFSEHSQQIGTVAQKLLPSLKAGGSVLLSWFANLVLLPVLLFYTLRDGAAWARQLSSYLPPRWLPRVLPLAQETDRVLGEWLRGQLTAIVLMSLFYCVALAFTGLDYALPVGLIAGLLGVVPYLGMVLGLLLALLSGWLEFGLGWDLAWVAGVFVVGQLLEGMVITPIFVGERIGLHPVAVIFALLAFGQLLGFAGVLLALPLAACLLVLLRHLKPWYFSSRFYRG